ncbi:MAG: AAA family ATPase [Anaerolineales bacterium]|nr:AAA family ATPase [Anaerolineales bacterium]MCB9126308.1 AAA family ATPase [Ardenticatenales bacterium]MCB9171307.1 AAA family ATPase [Ardenticatenales bacterium]
MPPRVREALSDTENRENLVEVVLDIGRLPEARLSDRELTLGNREVSRSDLDYVVQRVGEFGGDNRAGIERTLHRISAIRNRRGEVVGLTCRVGRAVFGTIDIIRDLIDSDHSILLLGRPGVGKTTLLREAARVLAEKKRVVIVDTSNEIAGDGDIPHPAIGRARRMQVPTPELQHEIMIEAVENHTPQVVVIDEIGREEEAQAARTIAERGVQLIGTAHGNQLDNLMMNPTLSDLVGGIASVTLSDEEARRRGTQKSVLERRAPPTFDMVVEIMDRGSLAVHTNVAEAVDALLRDRALDVEVRHRGEDGAISVAQQSFEPGEALQRATSRDDSRGGKRRQSTRNRNESAAPTPRPVAVEEPGTPPSQDEPSAVRPRRLYPYGVSQNRLLSAAQSLNVPVEIATEVRQADVLVTLRSYYRKRPPVVADAERAGTPVYVLRSNTSAQMENALVDLFGLRNQIDPFELALREAREAIAKIQRGANGVELSPQNANIRREQHELARAANILSRSRGKEPNRRVRLYANNGVG